MGVAQQILGSLEQFIEGQINGLESTYGHDALVVFVIETVLVTAFVSFAIGALAPRFRKLFGILLVLAAIATGALLMAR